MSGGGGRLSSILHPGRRRSNSVQYSADSGLGADAASYNSSLNSNVSLEHVQEEGDFSPGGSSKCPGPCRRFRSASLTVGSVEWSLLSNSSSGILVHGVDVPVDQRNFAVPLNKSLSLPNEKDDSGSVCVYPSAFTFDYNMFVVENPEEGYARLLQAHPCFEAVPNKTRLIVLDTRLPVKKAFSAFVNNGARAALVWQGVEEAREEMGESESVQCGRLIGVLSITDFIRVLLKFHDEVAGASGTASCGKGGLVTPPSSLPDTSMCEENHSVEKRLEDHEISTWRRILSQEGLLHPFLTITSHESLFRAAQLLLERPIHRLPVLDPISLNALHILTLKDLLRFLWRKGKKLTRPECLSQTASELGLGAWGDAVTVVYPDTPLLSCLRTLLDHRISGLPVISRPCIETADPGGRVVDMYTRFDAIGIAADQSFDRLSDLTVEAALHNRKDSQNFEGVVQCQETDSLAVVIEKLVDFEVHRVVIVNGMGQLRGLVALKDVMSFLVLRPLVLPSPLSPSVDETEEMEWSGLSGMGDEMEIIREEAF